MSALLVLAWAAPLAAAALAPASRFWWLPPFAAMPALAAAVLITDGHRLEIPWLLLGTVLGLDGTGRIFLAFTSFLWLAAGLYAAGSLRTGPHAGRFRGLFLLAMAGNLWLIVGLDLVSFYLGFSLMGLASYGLVVHEGDKAALRAGKVYLVMTLVGELALFVSLVLIAGHVGGLVPERAQLVGLSDLTMGLLIVGLAIKAGLVPLHVWLPLAHPAAPVPASAVLSGAMIKVALLGWLRFLPVGEVPMTEWGLFLVFVGLVTLFFAIPIGLVQSNPKVILAYSSVSKMGLMGLTLGLILLEPSLAPAGILALAIYAAHHGIVKGGLFLSVGLRHQARAQGLVLAGTILLALSLAGVPPSGGAVVKYGIKPALASADWSWLATAVALSTAGTALLMARFAWVIWRTEPHPSQGLLLGGAGWAGLIGLSLLVPLLLGSPASWTANALPIAIAAVLVFPIALVAWRRPNRLRPMLDGVPAGDLLVLLRPLLSVLGSLSRDLDRRWSRLLRSAAAGLSSAVAAVQPAPKDPERGLRRWPNAGAAWLLITVLLAIFPLWTLPELRPWRQPGVAAEVSAARSSRPEPSIPEIDARPPTSAPTQVPNPDAGVSTLGTTATSAPPEVGKPSPSGPAPEEESAGVTRLQEAIAAAVRNAPAATPEDDTMHAEPGEDQCDPAQAFVFSHPGVGQPLRLRDCARGAEGVRRLVSPPLTNRLVELVQRHLNDLGYSAGPVDGLMGPRTREAIRRFQRESGEAATGTIDFRLLQKIKTAAAEAAAAGTH